ncbi:MAG: zinc-binding dehydrogenase [Cyanobacteria bacterium J06632_19]
MTQLAQLVDEGKIYPLLDSKSFKFTEIAVAHYYAESRKAIAKVTLDFGF